MMSKRDEELAREMIENEKKQRQQELDDKQYSCAICFDDYKINEIYVIDGCNHKYCIHCLKQYIITNINEGNVVKLQWLVNYQSLCFIFLIFLLLLKP